MIELFHIPRQKIDTKKLGNLLHGPAVQKFEQAVAKYVGAKYAVATSSATAAIFLLAKSGMYQYATIPSMIPPVVPNALVNAGIDIEIVDDVDWVGKYYTLLRSEYGVVIDSAQALIRDQFSGHQDPSNAIIYSFYPTKPVSSCDGGMIVTNNEGLAERIRLMSRNGQASANSWDSFPTEHGWKMYMNSIQATIAHRNLKKFPKKWKKLAKIRAMYDRCFGKRGLTTGHHLYRVKVETPAQFLLPAAERAGIRCGIHYQAIHNTYLFENYATRGPYTDTENAEGHMLSIPFHEKLSKADIMKVVDFVGPNLRK